MAKLRRRKWLALVRRTRRLINTAEVRDRNDGDALCRTGLIECLWEQEHDGRHTKDEVGEWVALSSEFYPQLSEAFQQQFERWAAKREWPKDPDEDDYWADEEEQEVVR